MLLMHETARKPVMLQEVYHPIDHNVVYDPFLSPNHPLQRKVSSHISAQNPSQHMQKLQH